MIKSKITKTTYEINHTELMIAVRDFIVNKLKLSQDIEKHSFELQCTVDADRRLTQIEGTFTKIEKPKKVNYENSNN